MQKEELMSNTLIQFDQVTYSHQSRVILDKISLELLPETITTLIGPNGAGKSTLVKLASGLLAPTAGHIIRVPQLRIGYMPQKLSLDRSLPIKVSRFLSFAEPSRQARNDAMQLLGISHLKSQQVHDLSGGELQRVLLARAILRKPHVLILDEPLQGVDITGQTELYTLIAKLKEDLGCAILMVSHDLHLVMAQTDSVLCLNGHICCHGKPESVTQHPEYLKLFGHRASENLAVYTHHHDHHHTLHGDAVHCDSTCEHEHD